MAGTLGQLFPCSILSAVLPSCLAKQVRLKPGEPVCVAVRHVERLSESGE